MKIKQIINIQVINLKKKNAHVNRKKAPCEYDVKNKTNDCTIISVRAAICWIEHYSYLVAAGNAAFFRFNHFPLSLSRSQRENFPEKKGTRKSSISMELFALNKNKNVNYRKKTKPFRVRTVYNDNQQYAMIIKGKKRKAMT